MDHHPSDGPNAASLTLSSSGLPIWTQSMPLSLPWAPGEAPACLTEHSPPHLHVGQNKAALAPPLATGPTPKPGPPGSRVLLAPGPLLPQPCPPASSSPLGLPLANSLLLSVPGMVLRFSLQKV